MIYSDDFIESLPFDTVEAGKLMCEIYFNFQTSINISDSIDDYYFDTIDAFVAIQEFVIAHNLLSERTRKSLSENKYDNIVAIREYFNTISTRLNDIEGLNVFESARIRYSTHFENAFSFRFTDGDLKRIQTLINSLRDSINDSVLFEENHKTRLLDKLEKLQNDIHKKMSNIDNIYGLIGDAGVVKEKIGEEAKPMIDMITEILKIAWRAQSIAEELSSSSTMPMLNE